MPTRTSASAAQPAATAGRPVAAPRIRRAAALPMPDGADMGTFAPADPLAPAAEQETALALAAAPAVPDPEPAGDAKGWRPRGAAQEAAEGSAAPSASIAAASSADSSEPRRAGARGGRIPHRPILVAAAVAGAVIAATPFLASHTKDRTTHYEGQDLPDPVAALPGTGQGVHPDGYPSQMPVQDLGSGNGDGSSNAVFPFDDADAARNGAAAPAVPDVLSPVAAPAADAPAPHGRVDQAPTADAAPVRATKPDHALTRAPAVSAAVSPNVDHAATPSTETKAAAPVKTASPVKVSAPVKAAAPVKAEPPVKAAASVVAASTSTGRTAATATVPSTAPADSAVTIDAPTTPVKAASTTPTTAPEDRATTTPTTAERAAAPQDRSATTTPTNATTTNPAPAQPAAPTTAAEGRAATTATSQTPDPKWSTKVITAGYTLNAGETVASNRMRITMRTGGDLVISDERGTVRWSSHTSGEGNSAVFRTDGELMVHSASGQTLWSSGSGGHDGAKLVIQNDGNVTILTSGDDTVWAAGTQH